MKKFIQKIKENKVKSVLVGCCAFLFGFISVSLYNQVGDTYAIDVPLPDIECDAGEIERTDNITAVVCCPNDYTGNYSMGYCHLGSNAGDYPGEDDCPAGGFRDGQGECVVLPTKKVDIYEDMEPGCCIVTNAGKREYEWYDDILDCSETVDISEGSCSGLAQECYVCDGEYQWGNFTTCGNPINLSRNKCSGTAAPNKSACYLCNGEYKWGVFTDCGQPVDRASDDCKGTVTDKDDEKNYPYTPGRDDTSDGSLVTHVNTRKIYKITYDLNDGRYIDGSTSRTTFVPDTSAIGVFGTNPIKDGSKFKEWQYNNAAVNFNNPPTSDMTLVAVYEELDENDKKYECSDPDYNVLDISSKTCYKVLKPNSQMFNYTLYSYKANASFCWAGTDGSKGRYFHVDDDNFSMSNYLTITGKNDQPYDGYDKQDAWISNDTCLIGTECSSSDAGAQLPACETRWDAIVYSSKEATLADKTNKEADSSPGTGDSLILIAWIIGIGAIAYTLYYYKFRKN